MMFRTQRIRKNLTVIATATAITALAATIFAPAGFGRSLSHAAFWDGEPIIIYLPPTVEPGDTLACEVQMESSDEPVEEPEGAAKTSANAAVNVTVYSDPPGVVTYSGTVEGPNVVIPAQVSPDAAPGLVTVYVTTNGGANAISATTTVTE